MTETTASALADPPMDPRRRLSVEEVAAADLADWRLLSGRLRARFVPADYATGLELVARVGAAAEDADHHPETTLTYGEVHLSLSSHDVGGVTSRDLRIARRISDLARDLGVRADPSGLTVTEFALDTARAADQGRIYAALLGATLSERGLVVDPSGQTPTLWWQGERSGGTPSGNPLPEPEVEQRWHLDVWVVPEEAAARLEAALDAGATLLSDASAPSFWVLEDADGNRFCVCTPEERTGAA